MAQLESQMEHLLGSHNLRINRTYNSNQLLVKLSRNGKEWLSPIGWGKDEKGTLLDCTTDGKTTIVEIPKEFAQKLKDGDVVELTNPESDFKAHIVWGKATPKKTNGAAPTIAAAALTAATGLTMAEREKRAREAEKAAADYKTKMEAASKAHEAAQSAALEAARKADEALKAEAARISEMEQAARDFEEAEKLRLAEQRRLDNDRRIAEERRLEDLRLAEEVRLKAEADRLKKERSEARKFFKTEIEGIKSDKARLEGILETHNEKVEATSAKLASNEKQLSVLETSLSTTAAEEAERQAAFRKEEAKVSDLKARQAQIKAAKLELEKGNERLFKQLEKSDQAYQKAQKDVEAAKLKAVECLNALDAVKTESKRALEKKDSLIAESALITNKIEAQNVDMVKLKDAAAQAKLKLEAETQELETAKKTRDSLTNNLTSVKTDVSKTLADLKGTQSLLDKQKTSLRQLEDIEDADQIRILRTGSSSKSPASPAKTVSKTSVKKAKPANGGFLGRLFKKTEKVIPAVPSALAAAPQLAKDTKVKAAELKSDAASKLDGPIVKKNNSLGASKDSKGIRLNSWLMIGVAVTGLAVLGTAYATQQKSPAAQIATPKTVDAKPIQMASAGREMTMSMPTSIGDKPSGELEAINIEMEAPAIETIDEPIRVTTEETAETPANTAKQKMPWVRPSELRIIPRQKPVQKAAEVTKTPKPKKAAITVSTRPTAAQRRAARAAEAKIKAINNDIQTQLNFLGLYTGEINGLQTVETQTAIREFKAIYGIPVNNGVTDEFISALKKVVDERQNTPFVESRTVNYR